MADMARLYVCEPNRAYARGALALTDDKAQEALRSFTYGNPETGWVFLRNAEANLFYLRGLLNELRRVLGRLDILIYPRFVPQTPGELQVWMCLSPTDFQRYASAYDPINEHPHLTHALSGQGA